MRCVRDLPGAGEILRPFAHERAKRHFQTRGGGGEMAVRGEVGGESAADFARQMREEFREAFGGFAACGVRAGRLGECREQGVRIGCVVRLGGVRRGVCVPTGEFAGVLLRRRDEAHAKFVQASPDCRHEVGDAVGAGEGCAFGGGEEALDGVLVGVRRVEGVEASAAQACEEDAVEGVPDGRGDGGALGDAAEFGRAGGGVPREQDDGFVRIAAISHFGPLSFVVWGFTMKPATGTIFPQARARCSFEGPRAEKRSRKAERTGRKTPDMRGFGFGRTFEHRCSFAGRRGQGKMPQGL